VIFTENQKKKRKTKTVQSNFESMKEELKAIRTERKPTRERERERVE